MTTPPPGQPGQQPDPSQQQPNPGQYQQYPPQGAPAPGYTPQQPPKKRRKWPWIVGILVVLIVIIAVSTSGGGDDSTSNTASTDSTATEQAPAAGNTAEPAQADKDTVVYEVTSDSGTASSITYFGEDGNQSQETGATLPWRSKEFDKDKTTLKTVSAQNGGGGAITCKIIVDGKVEVENSSNGEYAVVSCQGKLF